MLLNAYNSKAKVMIEHILQNYKQPCPSYVQRGKNKLSYKKNRKKTKKNLGIIIKTNTWLTRRGTTLTND